VTVAELLDEARDFHALFTRQQVPDVACMRALSRYARRLAEKIVALDEACLATQATVDNATLLAAVDGRSGIPLPAHLFLLRPVYVVRTSDGVRVPVEITDHASRNTEGAWRFPAASIVNGKLYPLNLLDTLGTVYGANGWEEYDGLELMIVPLMDDLTGPTSVVALPDTCRDALVCNLALFMAGRTARTVSDLPLLPQQAMDAEAMAIATVAGSSNAGTWRIT
jgi:hypothetical protein